MEMALLPGMDGYFGVKANHVPLIAQLKPGVVELHDGADVSKYFISGGFAFVHPNATTDVCVLEAAPLDHFDATAVKTSLQAAQVRRAAGRGPRILIHCCMALAPSNAAAEAAEG